MKPSYRDRRKAKLRKKIGAQSAERKIKKRLVQEGWLASGEAALELYGGGAVRAVTKPCIDAG